jgi:hypothetical protein
VHFISAAKVNTYSEGHAHIWHCIVSTSWHKLKIWHGRHTYHPHLSSLLLAQLCAWLKGYFLPSFFTWKQMGESLNTADIISVSENGQCPAIILIWYQTTVKNPHNYITNVISTGISRYSLSCHDYSRTATMSHPTSYVMGNALSFLKSNADRWKKPITHICLKCNSITCLQCMMWCNRATSMIHKISELFTDT